MDKINLSRLTIILVRHGEAVPSAMMDHDRPLTPIGEDQARSLGRYLGEKLGSCDRAIVSTAKRAQQTGAAILGALHAKDIDNEPRLYTVQSFSEWAEIVRSRVKNTDRVVVIVGHNPLISAVASILSDETFRFAPAEYTILTIDSDDWETALASSGCWTSLTSPV